MTSTGQFSITTGLSQTVKHNTMFDCLDEANSNALYIIQPSRASQQSSITIIMLVCKFLYGLTAPHLTNDCQMVANFNCRRLWSADINTYICMLHMSISAERSIRQPELVTSWLGQIPWTNTSLDKQELSCHQSTVLKHFASGTPSARHWTCYISAAAKTHLYKCDPGE